MILFNLSVAFDTVDHDPPGEVLGVRYWRSGYFLALVLA